MTVLVVGGSGHLGGEVCRQLLSAAAPGIPAITAFASHETTPRDGGTSRDGGAAEANSWDGGVVGATRWDGLPRQPVDPGATVRGGDSGDGRAHDLGPRVDGLGEAAPRMTVVATYWRAPGPVSGVRWEQLDLRDRAAVDALVDAVRPSIVVNAAYDRDHWTANADGAGHVAAAAARAGARLVHISTDALHSGRSTPYLDDETPTPVTTYGASKAAAETAVRLVHPAAAIVRTSLIMGDADTAQIRLCLDIIRGDKPGALFADEYRCPIDVSDLAAAVIELAFTTYPGLINVAGPEAVSRADLGHLVARRHGIDPANVPISTLAEAGLIRPADVRLDISRAQSLLRTVIRPVSALSLGAPTPSQAPR